MKTVRIYYKDGDLPYSIYFPVNKEVRGTFIKCGPARPDDSHADIYRSFCPDEIKRNGRPSVLGRRAENFAPECIKYYAWRLANELGYKVPF